MNLHHVLIHVLLSFGCKYDSIVDEGGKLLSLSNITIEKYNYYNM